MSFNQRTISAWSNHWRSSATTHCLKQDQLQTYFKLPTCSRHILKLSLDSSLSRSVFNQSHCGHLFCLIPIRFSFAANSIHFFPPSYCAWLYLALSFPQPSQPSQALLQACPTFLSIWSCVRRSRAKLCFRSPLSNSFLFVQASLLVMEAVAGAGQEVMPDASPPQPAGNAPANPSRYKGSLGSCRGTWVPHGQVSLPASTLLSLATF